MSDSEFCYEIEKADPFKGIIQVVVFKARPAGSGEGDRDGDGLDPDSARDAMYEWVANFGKDIIYKSPITGRSESKYNGMYDSHRHPMKADLLGAWWFPDEMKFRVLVRPQNKQIAVDAAQGRISGSSWAGSALAYDSDN